MTDTENKKQEIDWSTKAGFVKTKEQMELIEQQAFQNGYQEAINDADAGTLRKTGIHATRHVKDYLDIYRTAVRQAIENDIRGVYRLGNGAGNESRLADRVLAEADEKFTGVLSGGHQEA